MKVIKSLFIFCLSLFAVQIFHIERAQSLQLKSLCGSVLNFVDVYVERQDRGAVGLRRELNKQFESEAYVFKSEVYEKQLKLAAGYRIFAAVFAEYSKAFSTEQKIAFLGELIGSSGSDILSDYEIIEKSFLDPRVRFDFIMELRVAAARELVRIDSKESWIALGKTAFMYGTASPIFQEAYNRFASNFESVDYRIAALDAVIGGYSRYQTDLQDSVTNRYQSRANFVYRPKYGVSQFMGDFSFNANVRTLLEVSSNKVSILQDLRNRLKRNLH